MTKKTKQPGPADQDYQGNDRYSRQLDEDREHRAHRAGRGGRNDHRPGSGYDEEPRGDDSSHYGRQDRYSGPG